MRSLTDTFARLAVRRSANFPPTTVTSGRLSELRSFGDNPGDLRAHYYLPRGLRRNAALVVVLHGCTQTAAGYDHGSGWSALADHEGFALLFPEQQRGNNPNLCFNWFLPSDTRRGSGEAASIHQMIGAFATEYAVDPKRVFITGLSAGGAMSAAMLAIYPETFAGGAVIAGLPFGVAATMPQAFDRMRGHGGPAAAQLVTTVRNASLHKGRWPSVSVWHGSSDFTVAPSNGADLAAQWRGIHGLIDEPSSTINGPRHVERIWSDGSGRALVRHIAIDGMGHGTPIDKSSGIGNSGAFMLDVGLSSTELIAQSWGLGASTGSLQKSKESHSAADQIRRQSARAPFSPSGASPANAGGIQSVIEGALRRAGLM